MVQNENENEIIVALGTKQISVFVLTVSINYIICVITEIVIETRVRDRAERALFTASEKIIKKLSSLYSNNNL